jgi:hypothetical protein
MPHVASLLVAASAAIALVLGLLHLYYTSHGDKLHPREPAVVQAMQQSALVLTRQTTVWRAWIGFNASHSFGLMLFGLVYGYLALAAPAMLFGSLMLRALGVAVLAGWVVLSRLYFFRVPFRSVAVAIALYLGGLFVAAV